MIDKQQQGQTNQQANALSEEIISELRHDAGVSQTPELPEKTAVESIKTIVQEATRHMNEVVQDYRATVEKMKATAAPEETTAPAEQEVSAPQPTPEDRIAEIKARLQTKK